MNNIHHLNTVMLFREVVYIALFSMAALVFLWFGLSKNTSLVGSGGKLSEPEYRHGLVIFDRISRWLMVAISAVLMYFLVVPIASDMLGSRKVVRGNITFVSVPQRNQWYLKQAIMLDGEKDFANHSYTLLFSFTQLNEGECVDLDVLPKSRMIVDFHFCH